MSPAAFGGRLVARGGVLEHSRAKGTHHVLRPSHERRSARQITTRPMTETTMVSAVPDTVTMDKIVALSKRRGFIFPSSEIYGGLGSTYDYGHYGVLLKTNRKNEWGGSLPHERHDI